MTPPLRVCLYPIAAGLDKGEGGVGRVIRAQMQHLPAFGIEVTAEPAAADVIACHIFFPGVVSVADTEPSGWVKQYPAAAFVLHHHGWYFAEQGEWPKWALEANRGVMESVRIADAVTAPSEWVRMAIARHTSRRAEMIYHGVDMEEWADAKSEGYVLWDKTRPDPVCDPGPMQAVAEQVPELQFVSTYGRPAANVRITGTVPYAEARALTLGAGVYLATSQETFGIATLQAMAGGVPIAGFDWGATPEFVRNGVDGILVRPGDINALADAIRECRDRREEFGANAREQASCFTWERACEAYADLYRRAHAERHPSPLVSVVVTSYNLGDYLPEALRSVESQQGVEWECIVVDDGSTDDSVAIAQDFTTRRGVTTGVTTVLQTPRNLGQAGARNFGIAAARGRYIMPLDADDRLNPGELAALSNALETDRRLSVAYGPLFWVDADTREPENYGGPPGLSPWPPARVNMQRQLAGPQRSRDDFAGNQLPYCSMFKRSMWDALGGIRRRLKTGEDADFWTRAGSYGYRMERVTEAPVVTYGVREKSLSSSQDTPNWGLWYPWRSSPERSPAGIMGDTQLPIPSLTPPAVSVVVPVGPGHERWLMDAIDSIAAQSMTWWEAVVVNDTGEPFDFPIPPWVRVLSTGAKGAGPGRARNIGIAASRAKMFLCLDADDMLEPHALETMWTASKGRPGVILYPDFWEDRDGPGKWKPYKFDTFDCDLLIQQPVGVNVRLVPKEAWAQVGGYHEEMPGWEDWDFQLRLAEVGWCFARIAEPLFSYRRSTGMVADQAFDRRAELRDRYILPRWGEYKDGTKKLMACGCSGAATATIFPPGMQAAMGVPGNNDPGMTLYAYEGEKSAGFSLRGPSGQVYDFAQGEPRYVRNGDIPWLEERGDFRKLEMSAIEVAGGQPVLQSQTT